MSEPMFPSAAPDAAVTAAAVPAEKGSRRLMFVIGGIAAGVALGGAAYLLLGSGGGSDEPSGTVAATAPKPASTAPAPSPSATAVPVIKTVTLAARDPFAPLYVAPVPAPTQAPVATTTGTTPTGPTGSTTGTTPVPTTRITLAVAGINASRETATVSVDGVKYSVGVGKTFAKTFLLYSVFNSSCVGILFGDQSVPVCTTSPATVSP